MRLNFAFAVGLLILPQGVAFAASPDPVDLARRIDAHLTAEWERAGVKSAPLSDDATYVRRVYLDLIGRTPTVAEVRAFLADSSPEKRAKLVDRLVESGGHNRHAAVFWRRVWVPQADTPQFARLVDGFEEWLAVQFASGTGYDDLVRVLLTVPPPSERGRGIRSGPAPEVFLTASEGKPENLAANTARAFLGINLDCAQCHDHPFARWSREQFWQTAAFFTRPTPAADDAVSRLEIMVGDTTRVVGPAVLTGDDLDWPDELTRATGPAVLSAWVTGRNNPFFARNAVNRVWANYFGHGLVEPLDDLGGDNPPLLPELLDDLATSFADSGYDLNYLTKAIVLSRAYQLSSELPAEGVSAAEAGLYVRMPVRGLTGEQLYDSLRVAAGLPVERDDLDPINALRDRKAFASEFHTARPATTQRSIIQALAMLNGPVTEAVTNPATTPTLIGVADAPFLDPRGKIETLFFAALGRTATVGELDRMLAHVGRSKGRDQMGQALADIFWALINSSEFNTNH